MSISQIRKAKERKRALFYKTLSLFLFFIVINALWITFFYEDDTLNIIYGILTPLLYCIIYYRIKKTRKRLKSKIKSHIYIPIIYALFGVFWYVFASFFIYVSDKLDGAEDEVYEANIEAINEQNTENLVKLNDSKNLFEKLNIQSFFLFNPNLAYPCKVVEEIEMAFSKKPKNNAIHYSKQQTQTIIIFITLFLIQIGAIYISEIIIYPRIKPQIATRRKKYQNFLKIEDVFIDENRIYENVEIKTKKSTNNFPKL